MPMDGVAAEHSGPVVVRRISEQIQSDADLMLKLRRSGIQPGREVTLAATDDGVRVTSEDGAGCRTAELPRRVAAHVFVAVR
jgi:DtxR family Mn-dependent transcriptional regulator